LALAGLGKIYVSSALALAECGVLEPIPGFCDIIIECGVIEPIPGFISNSLLAMHHHKPLILSVN
jgi:hypothetical protein